MRWASLAVILISACTTTRTGPAGGDADARPHGVTGLIHLHVHVQDGVVWGSTVVIEDGSGVHTVALDDHDDAVATIEAPASVTVRMPHAHQTITGVEPDDALCFFCPPPASGPTITTHLVARANPDAATYSFGNGEQMRFNLTSPEIDLPSNAPGPHDVLAVANDAAGRPVGWAFAPAQTLTDGGTITLTEWHAPAIFKATYDNLPVDAGFGVTLNRAEHTSADVLPAFAFWPTQGGSIGEVPSHGVATQPATAAGGTRMFVTSMIRLGVGMRFQVLGEDLPADSSYHLDGATDLLPWIRDVAYDASTRTLSWQASAGLPPDGVWATIRWQVAGDDWPYEWHVLVRGDATQVTFPILPGDDAPSAEVTSGLVEAYDLLHVTSYAEMRTSDPASWNEPIYRWSSDRFGTP